MTTVASTLKSMACDSSYTHTGGMQFEGGAKMIKLSKEVAEAVFGTKKAIVGGAGDASSLGSAWQWFVDPSGKIPKVKGSEFIALTTDGLNTSFNLVNWIKVQQDYYAIGSGMHFAAAALEVGKSSAKAVEVAMKFDPGTNFTIHEYKL